MSDPHATNQIEYKMKQAAQLQFSEEQITTVVGQPGRLDAFARRLARKRHRAAKMAGSDAPATYCYPGSFESLCEATTLPPCTALYASVDIWGHAAPQLTGDAVAQWCLQGAVLPPEGTPVHVFCMRTRAWVGSGQVYLEDQRCIALLQAGLYADFASYSEDASGLVLVFLCIIKRAL